MSAARYEQYYLLRQQTQCLDGQKVALLAGDEPRHRDDEPPFQSQRPPCAFSLRKRDRTGDSVPDDGKSLRRNPHGDEAITISYGMHQQPADAGILELPSVRDANGRAAKRAAPRPDQLVDGH